MKILVTGGAGYIGSFTVRQLRARGDEVTVYDNLVYGHPEALASGTNLIKGDLLDRRRLSGVFRDGNFEAVIHFAAYAAAGESMSNPYKYLNSNIQGSLNLLEVMREHRVAKIVFSSSCTVYGQTEKLPVSEDNAIEITNVYGESKYTIERFLRWYRMIFNLGFVSLRYFNASGAALDGSSGEDHDPETHIIPLAVKAALNDRPFTIFGNDYPTPDGTNVRDYIHVLDLTSAHLLALDHLNRGGESGLFNLGVGRGYSNKEVLDAIRKVTAKDLQVVIGPRRTGDAAAIYADSTKARKILGWQPRMELPQIVESAYLWHRNHPDGYGKTGVSSA